MKIISLYEKYSTRKLFGTRHSTNTKPSGWPLSVHRSVNVNTIDLLFFFWFSKQINALRFLLAIWIHALQWYLVMLNEAMPIYKCVICELQKCSIWIVMQTQSLERQRTEHRPHSLRYKFWTQSHSKSPTEFCALKHKWEITWKWMHKSVGQ